MKGYIRIVRIFILLFGLIPLGCFNHKGLPAESATEPLVAGDWVVAEQTISPLSIRPLCKPIQKGTAFRFTESTLEIYTGASPNPCGVYNFKITGNTISFIKEDMIWLCNYELSPDQLKLISDNFFAPVESEKSAPADRQSAIARRVVVLLKKKAN